VIDVDIMRCASAFFLFYDANRDDCGRHDELAAELIVMQAHEDQECGTHSCAASTSLKTPRDTLKDSDNLKSI